MNGTNASLPEKWFISRNGTDSEGPYSAQQIQEWISVQLISVADCFVWQEGMSDWVPLHAHPMGQVSALAPLPAPPLPAPELPMESTKVTRVTRVTQIKQTPKQTYTSIQVPPMSQFALIPGNPGPVDVLLSQSGSVRNKSSRILFWGFTLLVTLGTLGFAYYQNIHR